MEGEVSKMRLISLGILIIGALLGSFVYFSEVKEEGWMSNFPFRFGLDLRGGAHLVYTADVSGIKDERERSERMDSLRRLIEDRVDDLGVAEPLVQVERGGVLGEGDYRLIVELPGVTDVDEAIRAIGETPVLEFMLVKEGENVFDPNVGDIDFDLDGETEESFEVSVEEDEILDDVMEEEVENVEEEENETESPFIYTGLDGSMLNSARFERNQRTGEPLVAVKFNREGRDLFAEITRENVGRQLAILLDGESISSPVIREQIFGGEAVISGGFSLEEARNLARRLQAGALPVPIELVLTETVGPTLGQEVLDAGVRAALIGWAIVGVFMLLWYKFPGLIAIFSLLVYVVIMLSVFKLMFVTLTAAGLAGFILSIGMAVDANILIFERIKEELRSGKKIRDAVKEGFSRAWLSIRDANISTMIIAVILYYFGTPLVQGFAIVFFIGVLASMLTAISITRTFLIAIGDPKVGGLMEKLFYPASDMFRKKEVTENN